MSFDRWHDGEGYDLAAIDEMTPEERASLAQLLQNRSDWRDVRALAYLRPPGNLALVEKFNDHAVPLTARLAAGEELRELGEPVDLVPLLLEMLDAGVRDISVLTRVSDHIAWNLPADERVRMKVLQVLSATHAPVATSYASLAFVVWGLCESQWDWSHRPFWLRFQDEHDHDRAFDELLARLNLSREAALNFDTRQTPASQGEAP